MGEDPEIKRTLIDTEVVEDKGYEIRTEKWEMEGNPPTTVETGYTYPGGDLIGNREETEYLIKRGIKPEKADPNDEGCRIGFCAEDQKWYGWSHRVIHGFGIGDEVKEGDVTASSGWSPEYLREHPEKDTSLPVGFRAETLEDAKRMAIALADSVS